MDRGAWPAIVHGGHRARCDRVKDEHFHFHFKIIIITVFLSQSMLRRTNPSNAL